MQSPNFLLLNSIDIKSLLQIAIKISRCLIIISALILLWTGSSWRDGLKV